jgi:uncharacterized membrane protein YhaH (DUF805 family)
MGFVEAIQSGFANFTNFGGRSSRSAYWWWFLFNALAVIVAQIIDTAVRPGGFGAQTYYGLWSGLFSWIVSVVLFIPGLAVLVRRLHDTDRSGWWFLVVVIPIIGAIILIVFLASPGTLRPNGYGPSTSGTTEG